MSDMTDTTRCELCGTNRWDHNAMTLACPRNKWDFHGTNRFTPVPATPAPVPDVILEIDAALAAAGMVAGFRPPPYTCAPVPEDREEATAPFASVGLRECVECPVCVFEFAAIHHDEAGNFSCPNCEEGRLSASLVALEEENKRLRDALEFYADRENYKLYQRDLGKRSQIESSLVEQDKGTAARTALMPDLAHGHTEGPNG